MSDFSDWPWRHWRRQRPDAAALIVHGKPFSWQALTERVDALAQGFKAQGLRAGDDVALRARNGEDSLFAWLSLLQCGARVLPLNPRLPDTLIKALLAELTPRFGLTLEDISPLPGIVALQMTEVTSDTALVAPWRPEQPVSMTLTSGSTGLPKAAVHSAAAHLASAEGVIGLMKLEPQDRYLLSLPMFHVSGQGIFWRWLLCGAVLVVRNLHPLEKALEGCTHASLVPTQLWRLLEQSQSVSLKAVLLGGASIPVTLTDVAAQRGIRCYCGYGLTELASTVCAKEADGQGDVGRALSGREVKIVNDEVWVRSRSMASGYWRNGGIMPFTNAEGFFATRDRGVIDKEGRLTVLGRLDNQFFSGGEGIQPEMLEQIIARHPDIHQVFVVPKDDPEFGQRPVAIVECNGEPDVEALTHWVSDKLARFQQPVAWLKLPAELVQGGIKISRKALRDWVNCVA